MTLGQRIQELRKQKGLSQEGLGEKLGVSRQAVSRWEMDGAVPEVDKLVAMAKLFGVSLDQLLTGEETEAAPAAGKGRRRSPSLMAVLCILLSLALAVSLSFNFYYRYQVLMIRTQNDVNISNSERAQMANNAGADAFVRIHANGSDNTSVKGAMGICPTSKNPYCANIYASSRKLTDCIMNAFQAATGVSKATVWETDTMSGINWCQVPVTIVEMGYMSNAEEDALMATEDYQAKMVQGMANGIDQFFTQ